MKNSPWLGVGIAVVLVIAYFAFQGSSNSSVGTNTTTPSPQTVAASAVVTPPPPEDKTGCEIKAEGIAIRSWIRSCYLRQQLTSQCQAIFDQNGNYLVPQPKDSSQIASYWQQYLNDETACSCPLPADISSGINNQETQSKQLCTTLYPDSTTN